MSGLDKLIDLAGGLEPAELAQVIDLAERLRQKHANAGPPAEFLRVKASLDALPDHDDEDDELSPEFAAELDRRKAVGGPRLTLEDLGL